MKRFILAFALTAFVIPAFAQPSLAPQKRITPLRTDATDSAVQAGSPQGLSQLSGVIGKIKDFTVADLTAAAEDAEAQLCTDGSVDADGKLRVCPDPAGKCWRTLIPLVQAQQSPLPAGLGLAQALQKARDLRRKVQAGVPDIVKEACAIVLWDAEKTLLQFGLRLAPLPGLPGLP
jgi:hypothetical protein